MEENLTNREANIVELIAQGFSNKEIAQKLDITVETVKIHVKHILKKLGVDSRTKVISYYFHIQNQKIFGSKIDT